MKYLFCLLTLSMMLAAQNTGVVTVLEEKPARCKADASIPDNETGLVKVERLTAEEIIQVDAARKARDEAQSKLNSLVAKLRQAHGECGEDWMEWGAGRIVEIQDHFALISKWRRSMADTIELNVK